MDEIITQHREIGGIQKYKSLIRTTLAETENLPMRGIYILAYMGRIIYVGKATGGVASRLQGHWYDRGQELLGTWMDRMQWDWRNIRLDVLEPPDENSENWVYVTESALIKYFKPLFNYQLQGERKYPLELQFPLSLR